MKVRIQGKRRKVTIETGFPVQVEGKTEYQAPAGIRSDLGRDDGRRLLADATGNGETPAEMN